MKAVLEKSDMKVILHSKRANMYYLEKCRVMQKDGCVVYLTQSRKENLYWNIPLANTTVILLGNGTSITQAAMRLLCGAGVMVGFCGGGGTPLLAGTEVEWLPPQNEYRPTEYVQGWLSFWYDEKKRLIVAKAFQRARCGFIEKIWGNDDEMAEEGLYVDDPEMESALSYFRRAIDHAENVQFLLTSEAKFTKQVYKYVAQQLEIQDFVREHGKGGMDDDAAVANSFLDHGNYLAYGLAATTLWVLGIPHGFAVMHGKTRRGALVFDVADLIKDAVVLPWSFIAARRGYDSSAFRTLCLQKFAEHGVLDFMFAEVEKASRLFAAGDAS